MCALSNWTATGCAPILVLGWPGLAWFCLPPCVQGLLLPEPCAAGTTTKAVVMWSRRLDDSGI